MSRRYVELGSSPAEEPCAQVGTPDYAARAASEMSRYRELLRTKLGPEPEGAALGVRWESHDFGRYGELVCYYSPVYPDSVAYAFACESHGPATWTDNASVDWRATAPA